MDSKEVGKRIKQRRQDLEISVMDLVNATGLSKATLHRYESGDVKNIKKPALESIANVLGVSPEWLEGLAKEPIQKYTDADRDIQIILGHALKIVHSRNFTSCSKKVSEDDAKLLELGISFLLAVLYKKNEEGM